ncbi:hypothetical protein PJ985_13535 [Streptomyces sp. ACA25]|uniref:hypothetical protein n=1 Tax=Streptomyces sp. ACA25 TaxID=3022596 RepID=UPI002307A8DB|nr:hypothetical protein [Streptomyces sp. ACA25]MDB1088589.1 hypothetical protein [Streptomyces sp. ACA25]
MNASHHEQHPRARADQLAAVLVMLGHTPQRDVDPQEDCRAQQALLLAAAMEPYVDSAADPAVCGQPAVFADAVQEVEGRPDDPYEPVHQHLLTHLGLSVQYLHALYGPLPGGRERQETLGALRHFTHALLATAASTQTAALHARMGLSSVSDENRMAPSVTYVLDAGELARLARQASRAAEEFLSHLDEVAPEKETP